MWHIFLHTYLSVTKITLLCSNNITIFSKFSIKRTNYFSKVKTILNTRIFHVALLVHIDLLTTLHQQTLLPEVVNVFLIVAPKLIIDNAIELRKIFCRYMLTIVLKQSSLYFLVKSSIPCITVILKTDILFLWIVLWSFNLHLIKLQSTC